MNSLQKDKLIVLDFDGFLINSYKLMKLAFEEFGLDVGDEERFRNRRKFLKYIGGGKEFLLNLVKYTLPKKKKIRQVLTEVYQAEGRIYPEFVSLLNEMIEAPCLHVGIISRNFTHKPGRTIRTVLNNSGVDEARLDFLIPVAAGVKKNAVLEGMKSSRYRLSLFGGDEIGDYSAAIEAGYNDIIMSSYGFDRKERLITAGKIPVENIYDTPEELVTKIRQSLELENYTFECAAS